MTSFTCPRCGMTSHHPEDVRQGYCGNCHDWTGEPVDGQQGVRCPGCGQPAELVLVGGGQAFCGNEDCHVFSWDPAKTLAELADDMQQIELPEAFRKDER